jgi:hypothetical protein
MEQRYDVRSSKIGIEFVMNPIIKLSDNAMYSKIWDGLISLVSIIPLIEIDVFTLSTGLTIANTTSASISSARLSSPLTPIGLDILFSPKLAGSTSIITLFN